MRVLVFAEDVMGFTLARDLLDRVVVDRGPDWLSDIWGDRSLLGDQRTWTGVDPTDRWTKWTTLKTLDRQRHGVTHGLGIKGYALRVYGAAHIVATLDPLPDLVVFCIDTQGNELLRDQMLDGWRRANVGHLPFVLAVAHQESEAWVIAGFVPENPSEKATLARQTVAHGFDPTSAPHRLTPNHLTNPHDAKRTADALLPDGTLSPRAERCWLDQPLPDLERRGRSTGLPEYLTDVAGVVIPLLAGGRRV